MFCPNCGNNLDQNSKFCNKCGKQLIDNTIITSPNNQQMVISPKNNKKDKLFGIIIVALIILAIIGINVIFGNSNSDYYFSENSYDNNEEDINNIPSDVNNDKNNTSKSKYSTVIIADNTYTGVEIKNSNDAYNLIKKDSTSQKDNCPTTIKNIENQIINEYGIVAVNFCEMDVDFAKELANVIKKIYDEYPSVRGYITNLTLINGNMSSSYIAAFQPQFLFATSDSYTGYPWVFKTQILLNTTYFLNPARLESSVKDGSASGHFPPNATMYSPLAHEFGHYLSFLAMMRKYEMESVLLINNDNISGFYDLYEDFGNGKHSLEMITEAYEKYKKDTNTTLTIDEWRGTISSYALAKDNNGEYIYDETIAESFHDVYLNGNNAKDASKYVVNVLKERLGS